MFFKDIDPEFFRGKVVFLDIDGTILPDGEPSPMSEEDRALAALARAATVYLVSNKGLLREPELVARYGIEAIVSPHRKPSARVLDGVPLPDAPRVVIGDKVLTDGWFAKRIGAEFIHVDRVWSGRESLYPRILCLVDDVAWFFLCIAGRVRVSKAWQFVTLARPAQWVKNLLMLAPLFFVGAFFSSPLLATAICAVISFSLAASAGYVFNDILDREEDRRHPKKKMRPLASGRISVSEAILFGATLLLFMAFFASFVPAVAPWIVSYFVLQYLYSSFFRAVPVLEFIVVSSFFVFRILAGGAVVQVPISGWLLLTTFFAALFVITGKRYSESRREGSRSVIRSYPQEFLAVLPAISAVLAIVAYAIYSVLGNPHAGLVYSNVFVISGILWYLRGIYAGATEEPEAKLWSDLVLLCTVGLWGLFLVGVFYHADAVRAVPYLWQHT